MTGFVPHVLRFFCNNILKDLFKLLARTVFNLSLPYLSPHKLDYPFYSSSDYEPDLSLLHRFSPIFLWDWHVNFFQNWHMLRVCFPPISLLFCASILAAVSASP